MTLKGAWGYTLGPWKGPVVRGKDVRVGTLQERTVHVVTKILIVFGAVLSILLAALTIAFASNADAIRDSVAAEQAQNIALSGDLQAERTKTQTAIAELKLRAENAEADKARIATELANLQNERATLKKAVSEAELAAERLRNEKSTNDVTAQTQAKMIEALTTEVRELRKAQADAAKRESDLVNRLNDLESQRQVLEQSTRALQEQLNEAKQALETARTGGDKAGGTAGVPTESFGPMVQSRVRQVMASPTGDQLVEITDGSNAGLRVNQKMYILRDGKFIANLVLTVVEARGAVGRVDKLGRAVEAKAGDVVLSKLGLD